MLTTCRPKHIDQDEEWPIIPEPKLYKFVETPVDMGETHQHCELLPNDVILVQNMEDFKTKDDKIEYPHFSRAGSMDQHWDFVREKTRDEALFTRFWHNLCGLFL